MDTLDESQFVRHRLYGQKLPKWRQYAAFVTGETTLLALVRYELITCLLGPMPGALGLALRRVFYRKLFRKVGKNLVVGRNAIIRHADKIDLGDNVVLDDGCMLDGRGAGDAGLTIGSDTIVGRSAIVQSKVGAIRIGSNCNIGTYAVITSQGGVEIGDWVQIAGGCKISGGRFKLDPTMKEGVPYTRSSAGPIRIGECCFLGGSAQVTDGVTIGAFSVIGTGAVVMNKVKEYSVFMARPGMIMGTTLPADEQARGDRTEGVAAPQSPESPEASEE